MNRLKRLRGDTGARNEDSKNKSIDRNSGRYIAVARGRVCGIYEVWEGDGGAKEQVTGFDDALYEKTDNLSSAVQYLCLHGIPEPYIRLFPKPFRTLPNFKPDPTASFNDEFDRLMSSQNTPREKIKTEKVVAIHGELVSHYLPGGVPVDHNGKILLNEEQRLQIYQALCQHAGKASHDSIELCLLELKACPFVNIIDLIDACRSGNDHVDTFSGWNAFKRYTIDEGRTIPINEARKDEFLAPLLQNFRKGPVAVNAKLAHARIKLEIQSSSREDRVDRQYASAYSPEVEIKLEPIDPSSGFSPSIRDPLSPETERSDSGEESQTPGSDYMDDIADWELEIAYSQSSMSLPWNSTGSTTVSRNDDERIADATHTQGRKRSRSQGAISPEGASQHHEKRNRYA